MPIFNFLKSQPKKSILEVLKIDLAIYPDDTFIIDRTNEDTDKTVYKKLELENKFFGIFSELTIHVFENITNKNYIFHAFSYEFDKYDLPDFIEKIVNVYGKDDSGLGLFSRNDSHQIDDGYWSGRTWQNRNKYPVDCAIDFDEENGLFFTIWT